MTVALADQAVQRVKQGDAHREDEKQKKLAADGAKLRDEIAAGLIARGIDAQVVYLDTVSGTHPVRKTDSYSFNNRLSHPEHTLHRIRVDDVVLIGAKPESNEFGVEQPCARCRRPAYVFAYTSDITGPVKPNVAKTDYSHPLQAKNRFLHWLGRQLSEDRLCWDCRADLGDRCNSCNRSYTNPPVEWAIIAL